MKNTPTIEKKILANLRRLPSSKKLEVFDFIGYLRRKEDTWKDRFKDFLKKIDPKMKKISYSAISHEIKRARNK